MENQKDIISSQAKLSTIAEIMFFSPFVKNNVRVNKKFSPEEKSFINWYYKIWIFNIIILFIVIIAAIINSLHSHFIFSWISRIWSIILYMTICIPILICINNVGMRKEDENIRQDIQNKKQLLKAYLPILNFKYWFHQENYNMPYRWLKESILLRTIFIFWTFIFWNMIGLTIFLIILARVILLLINIDIIPLNVKKAINQSFLCNPWEIVSYFSAHIISKLKKIDYTIILETEKQKYQQWQKFWIWIIIQYLIFIAMVCFIHKNITVSIEYIVLVIAFLLRVIRIILFYKNKKAFLKIPIISEIVSLVFH